MSEKFEAFERDEVADIMTQVSGGLQTNLRDEITKVIETGIRDFLFGLVNMQSLASHGAPQVMLRVRTFQTILDDFRSSLGDQYNQILTRIGRTIGFNFGVNLLRILKQAKRIPKEYPALLEFWAKFDSAAQMGEYSLDFKRDKVAPNRASVEVSIRDLFLTMGYDDEPLRHCPFITGYFEGAVDTSLFLWTRWLKESDFKDPKIQWAVTRCEDVVKEDEGVISFTVECGPEKFEDLKDNLAKAINECEEKKWIDSIRFGRIVLEHGLMRLADEDPSKIKISFGRLLGQIDKARLPIKTARWKDTYADCSTAVHTNRTLNEFNVMSSLFNIWRCVQEVERITASKEQIDLIKRDGNYIIP